MSMSEGLIRKKNFFYDQGADATLVFNDGETIKVIRSFLAFHCPLFEKEFFWKQTGDNQFHITDCDSAIFKKFLDSLLELKSITALESLEIYPIAHKYQAEKSLEECTKALTPSCVNETLCHTLNLGVQYECEELIDKVIAFLKQESNMIKLLNTEEYCLILEPCSVGKILEHIQMDSSTSKLICKWAQNYLKKNNKPNNVSQLLKEHKLLDKTKKFEFESVQSILNYQEAEETKNLFTPEEFRTFLNEKTAINNPRKFPNNSEWITAKQGESFTEYFSFPENLNFYMNQNQQTVLEIWRNEAFFMEPVLENENPVSFHVSFTYGRLGENFGGVDYRELDPYSSWHGYNDLDRDYLYQFYGDGYSYQDDIFAIEEEKRGLRTRRKLLDGDSKANLRNLKKNFARELWANYFEKICIFVENL